MEGSRRVSEGIGGVCLKTFKKVVLAGLTCTFSVGGAIVGSVTGALKGQTTETGLVRGAGIGAVAGALVSLELLESLIQGEPLSKFAMFASLLNGKVFREWVSPAMLKAYQWQISTLEVNDRETSDIFDTSSNKGMLPEIIKELPKFEIICGKTTDTYGESSCAVCLQYFKEGESARRLAKCRHCFHMGCIDRWLLRHGSCPICRQDVEAHQETV